MEDVNGRIVIAAEAGNSLKSIKSVKKGISEITDSRLNDLKITQAKAKFELAEYRSMIAAQKAYNAEIKLEGAIKRLNFRKSNGAGGNELERMASQVEELRGNYLSLANAESAANLEAYQAKVAVDQLTNSMRNNKRETGKAASGLKNFFSGAGARTFGKLARTNVGSGSNMDLFKQGILVAGFMSVLKITKTLMARAYENKIYELKLASDNTNSLFEVAKQNREAAKNRQAAVESLEKYQGVEQLSALDSYEMSLQIKKLGANYKDLGLQIDKTTGTIKNYDEFVAKSSRLEINKEISEINSQLRQIKNERQNLNKIISEDTHWNNILTDGQSSRDAMEASKRDTEIGQKESELLRRRKELEKEDPEGRYKAIREDRMMLLTKILKTEYKRYSIQLKANQGYSYEARWLEKRNELQRQYNMLSEKELNKYKAVTELNDSNLRIAQLNTSTSRLKQAQQLKMNKDFEGLGWLSFSQDLIGMKDANLQRVKEAWTKNYQQKINNQHDDRLNKLRDEIAYERILLTGDEKRARIFKIQNELSAAGATQSQINTEVQLNETLNQLREIKSFDTMREALLTKTQRGNVFKETSQQGIYANSIEAVRLQSRVATRSPEYELQQKQLALLTQIRNSLSSLAGPTRTAVTTVRA